MLLVETLSFSSVLCSDIAVKVTDAFNSCSNVVPLGSPAPLLPGGRHGDGIVWGEYGVPELTGGGVLIIAGHPQPAARGHSKIENYVICACMY